MNIVLRIFPVVVIWLTMVSAPAQRLLPARDLPVRLTATPLACLVPCSIRLDIWVTSNSSNRWLEVEVDGPEFHGSRIQLNGEYAPTHFSVPFILHTTGTYEGKAVLYNSTREVSRQRIQILVKGDQ